MGSGLCSVAVDPLGKFLYVINYYSRDFSAYTIDATSGALAPLPGSPFAAGELPWGVAVAAPKDTVPPTIAAHGNVTVDATSAAGAIVDFVVTATDNVSPPPSVSCSPVSGSTFPIGTTTVTCTATDLAGNSANGSFDVFVKGAMNQATDVIAQILSFNLNSGVANSLVVKVSNVQATLASGRPNSVGTACNELNAFINPTRAQSGKALTVNQANQLIGAASRMEAVLGCR